MPTTRISANRYIRDVPREIPKTSFSFNQTGSHLIINALIENNYSVQLQKHPLISFDDIQVKLYSNQYQLIQQTNQILKIKVAGLIVLELKSKAIPGFQHVKQTFKQLQDKVEAERLKNKKLEQQCKQLQKNLTMVIKDFSNFRQSNDLKLKNLRQECFLLKKRKLQAQKEFNNKDKQPEIHQKNEKLNDKSIDIKQKVFEVSSFVNQKEIQQASMLNKKITKDQHLKKDISYAMFKGSKVIAIDEERRRILNFFLSSLISTQLLYRASDNEFSTQKFHQKCDEIPHTLTVCTTEFGKKIGGFNPFSWRSPRQAEQYKADFWGDSFIFSLTHNDKFKLQQLERAILNDQQCGPAFGDGIDFIIHDQADRNNESYANIGKSYKHEHYEFGDKSSWERFCGNPRNNQSFKIKEWEVWRLFFR